MKTLRNTPYHPTEIDRLLVEAFENNSMARLSDFFSQWESHIPPRSDEEYEHCDKLIQATYDIFETFYQPNEEYRDAEYVVIQNQIVMKMLSNEAYETYSSHWHPITPVTYALSVAAFKEEFLAATGEDVRPLRQMILDPLSDRAYDRLITRLCTWIRHISMP